MAKATHTVTHRRQYLMVGGKLQHVPAGTDLTLTPAQAESLEKKGRVMKVGQKVAVDLASDEKVGKADAAAKAAGIDA